MDSLSLKTLQDQVAYQRDEKAYRRLFLYYYHQLSRFAFGFVKTKEAAEEVVSDVMLKLWTLDERLSGVANLTVYLYRATRNQSLNHIRGNKHRAVSTYEVTDEVFGFDNYTPESFCLANEWNEQLRLAVGSLPPKCQMVYKLVREDGLTYKEAAQVMEISENTVDRHLNNALHKLIKGLRAYAC